MSDRALTPELLVGQQVVSDPQVSPDGTRVLYQVGPISHEGEHPTGAIWMVGFDGGGARRFTRGPGLDSQPRWSPDGRLIAFVSDREEPGKPALHVMPSSGGEARKAQEARGEAGSPRWSPDGRYLAFLLKQPETDEERRRKEERDDAHVLDENLKFARVFVRDVATGEERQLTPDGRHVGELDWSPDSTRVVALVRRTPLEDEHFVGGSIEVYPLDGGEPRTLAEPRGPVGSLRWSPNGRWVSWLGSSAGEAVADVLFVLDLEAGGTRTLLEDYEGTCSSYSWDLAGRVRFVAYEGLYGALNQLSLDGRVVPLLPTELRNRGSYLSEANWSADGTRFAVIRSTSSEPGEVWAGGVSGGVRRLTTTNPELEAALGARAEPVSWRAPNGIEIQGIVLYPPGYEEGRVYPTVVVVHGGPAWLWSDRLNASWHDWGQVLAASGYVVLLPNPRGSTGRGRAFARASFDDVGGGELTDVLSGVDYLVARGVADPDRLGIGGWSWGGYLTAWAISRMDRFRAAVVGAGVTDLFSDQGQNDVPHMNDYYFRRSAYDDPMDYLKRSALFYARAIRTPTLVLHGEADERVTMAQGRELYAALKYLGREARMVIYPRQGHRIGERRHQLDLLGRVLAWFDEHLTER